MSELPMPCAAHLPGGPTGLQELVDASVSSGPELLLWKREQGSGSAPRGDPRAPLGKGRPSVLPENESAEGPLRVHEDGCLLPVHQA